MSTGGLEVRRRYAWLFHESMRAALTSSSLPPVQETAAPPTRKRTRGGEETKPKCDAPCAITHNHVGDFEEYVETLLLAATNSTTITPMMPLTADDDADSSEWARELASLASTSAESSGSCLSPEVALAALEQLSVRFSHVREHVVQQQRDALEQRRRELKAKHGGADHVITFTVGSFVPEASLLSGTLLVS